MKPEKVEGSRLNASSARWSDVRWLAGPWPAGQWIAAAIFVIVLAASATSQTSAPATVAKLPTVAPADATRYLNDIKALTVPAMEGRGDDTKGIMLATQMLEDRYKSLGLQPAGTQGFAQPFSVTTGARMIGSNTAQERSGDAVKEIKLNEDFTPISFSESGTADAPVVFAGYGVTATEFGYDDYAGLDVRGKIVVLLRYEPPQFAAKSGNRGYTRHATIITKAINARDHGAKAVVIVNGQLPQGQQDTLLRFGSVGGPENAGILLLQMKNEVAQRWFEAAGKQLDTVQSEINSGNKPESFTFPDTARLAIEIHVEPTRATVDNVLAYLPGQTNEYVIIGAHYDHLGYGHYGSLAPAQIGQIHPGADDNASGTAGVLELARLLMPLKGKLRRGILFSSYAGEELGLLGSEDWVKDPTRPLSGAVAMLNMDMIGRISGEKVYIGGIGTGSTFPAVLEEAEKGTNFHFESSFSGEGSSDHTSFVSKQIPALFFFSGLHSDYHRPSDTWDKIDAPDAANLLNMVAKVALEIDESNEKPTFIAVKPEGSDRSGAPSEGEGGGGYGPFFGSVPDFGQSDHGVRFSDVETDSPAAKAGLKAGDVLVRFGDQAINNLYDFTDALRRHQPGDVVDVTVERDGKPLKVSVHLEQRH